ncbi:hypothetical protein C8F04DRAFT_1230317 [Mycena alexandri]|uniref:Uncharacterized protein n=1 Tax=Mycena alexandri TaxID=1745969 RepID=A0AAD6XDR7_9AGAR|nr:hypothetical protein C8F04DRAFT_1230317 [Mycena alexandri]
MLVPHRTLRPDLEREGLRLLVPSMDPRWIWLLPGQTAHQKYVCCRFPQDLIQRKGAQAGFERVVGLGGTSAHSAHALVPYLFSFQRYRAGNAFIYTKFTNGLSGIRCGQLARAPITPADVQGMTGVIRSQQSSDSSVGSRQWESAAEHGARGEAKLAERQVMHLPLVHFAAPGNPPLVDAGVLPANSIQTTLVRWLSLGFVGWARPGHGFLIRVTATGYGSPATFTRAGTGRGRKFLVTHGSSAVTTSIRLGGNSAAESATDGINGAD